MTEQFLQRKNRRYWRIMLWTHQKDPSYVLTAACCAAEHAVIVVQEAEMPTSDMPGMLIAATQHDICGTKK